MSLQHPSKKYRAGELEGPGSAQHHHRNWGQQKSSVRERKKNVGSPEGRRWERERWRENMNKWKIMSSLM